MYQLLENVGFIYGKISAVRKFLLERGDIIVDRVNFIKNMYRVSDDFCICIYSEIRQEMETSEFHQESGAGLLCVTLDTQNLALFRGVNGCFLDAHNRVVSITIQK
jgi:hypothetical protein